jgi:glutamate racemase
MRDGMRAEAPIGMFDSGIGGLTVAKALMERLPRESLHYVGDTAHMPYGDKSPERLREYAYGIAERLRREGCKALVVACNSASSNALEAVVEAAEGLPVIDVVHPMVAWAATHHAGGRLALIGTRATVQSDIYARLLRARGVEVTSLATPLLASAIEEGFHNGTISHAVVEAYFADGWAHDKDALVLACTHYPLVLEDIRAQLPPGMAILDAPTVVSAYVEEVLRTRGLLSTATDTAFSRHRFEVTDWTQSFADGAAHILGHPVELLEVPWPETT